MQNAELCMLCFNDLNLELISEQVVENIINKKIKIYHICYEVSGLDNNKLIEISNKRAL